MPWTKLVANLPILRKSHPLGANRYEVRAFLADLVEPYFQEWFRGQTGAIDPETGNLLFYTHDVERFGERLWALLEKENF